MTARISEFVVDTFLLGEDDGFDDDSLFEGSIVDSTSAMELVSILEETVGTAIEDREPVAANLDSITRLRAFVDGKVADDDGDVNTLVPDPGTWFVTSADSDPVHAMTPATAPDPPSGPPGSSSATATHAR